MAFQGYTQQTVDFMWGIRFNNERGWFLEHKDDYINTFLTPTRDLGEQVYDAVHALLPDEPLMLKVSRIYRDARRLFGRGPYKDHLWWCIRTGDKDWTGRPTFWFELGTARSTPAARARPPISCAPGIRRNPSPSGGKARWTSGSSPPPWRRTSSPGSRP